MLGICGNCGKDIEAGMSEKKCVNCGCFFTTAAPKDDYADFLYQLDSLIKQSLEKGVHPFKVGASGMCAFMRVLSANDVSVKWVTSMYQSIVREENESEEDKNRGEDD